MNRKIEILRELLKTKYIDYSIIYTYIFDKKCHAFTFEQFPLKSINIELSFEDVDDLEVNELISIIDAQIQKKG